MTFTERSWFALDGTSLVKEMFIREATDASRKKREKVLHKDLMKALTTKEVVSLAVIAITAPVFALGVVLAARVMVAAGNELMLLALTLCGAVVSGINGFGRRTVRAESQSRRSRGGSQSSVAPHIMRLT